MLDLSCGFCYSERETIGVTNSSCLPTDISNPWISSAGRCQTYSKGQQLSWAYDYCPSPYSWMPMVGLILYLVSFAPGKTPYAYCFLTFITFSLNNVIFKLLSDIQILILFSFLYTQQPLYNTIAGIQFKRRDVAKQKYIDYIEKCP